MKDRRIVLFIGLCSLGTWACALEDVMERGDMCPPDRSGGAQMTAILSGTNEPVTANTTNGDEALDRAFQFQWCPVDYPACILNAKQENGLDYFCMVRCGENEVPCFGRCVDPLNDADYCGAYDNCLGYESCGMSKQCQNGQCREVVDACKSDEERCVNTEDGKGSQSKCVNGEWEVVQNCEGSCHELECGECVTGDVRCVDDASHLGHVQNCVDGLWVEVSTCDGVSCRDQSCGECRVETEDDCVNDAATMVGQLTRCVNGAYLESSCAGNVSCQSKHACGECLTHKTTCSISVKGISSVTSCVEGKTEIQECVDVSCNIDGNRCGVCKSGDTHCENDQGVGYLSHCQYGSWASPTLCDGNYSCRTSETCGVCSDGATKCDAGKIWLCESGGWSLVSDCPNGASCKDALSCGECLDSTTRCQNDEDGGNLYTCLSGKWMFASSCQGLSCKDEETCGVCADGLQRCLNAQMSHCAEGSWVFDHACDGGFSCLNSQECGECVDDSVKCEENNGRGYLYTCSNGKWQPSEPCTHSCNATADGCGECVNETESCIGESRYVCNQGTLQFKATCDNGYSCKNATSCGNCKNETTQCQNIGNIGATILCQNGTWGETQTCDYGYSCRENGIDCGECVNGDTQCSDGKSRTCVNGAWGDWNACEFGGCFNETKCKECSGYEEMRCVDGPSNGVLQLCNNGEYITLSECIGACTSSKMCALCGENETVNLYCAKVKISSLLTYNMNLYCENTELKWGKVSTCP